MPELTSNQKEPAEQYGKPPWQDALNELKRTPDGRKMLRGSDAPISVAGRPATGWDRG